jgi:crotonobetainyl-CoA:carnitine CoA-transferase CaiB-like acyl-CoA transferase
MKNDKSAKPLLGVRVLDAATFLAGPFCATTMAEFGAEVIKVEHPVFDDPLRNLGTVVDGGETLMYLSEARNKKAITLDLGVPEGAEIFKRMVKTADVVIENFRPGTMERWGLGYDALSAVNPGIVMVRITAFGQDGPYKDRPGFARIAHAFSGLTYLVGETGRQPLLPGAMGLADYISGLYGLIGALMALRHRDLTGAGQYIDVALYESTFRMLDELVPVFARFGIVREPMGAETPTIVPHSHYKCADGSWAAIACSSDKMFQRLITTMGRPELATHPEYASMQSRVKHRDEINRMVSEWVGRYKRDDLMQICFENEIPCGPVNNIADIFADQHYRARGNLLKVEHPEAGTLEHLGPHKGVDTDAVLQDLLELTVEQIAGLRARKVI